MRRLFYSTLISVFLTSLLAGCGKSTESEKDAMTAVADSFACALYNFNYGKAIALCDSDSRKAIYFLCANLTEKDMEVIRNARQGASVHISDAECEEDSTGYVTITVNDFFSKDSIGSTGTIKKEISYRLPLKKEDGRWMALYARKVPVEK